VAKAFQKKKKYEDILGKKNNEVQGVRNLGRNIASQESRGRRKSGKGPQGERGKQKLGTKS